MHYIVVHVVNFLALFRQIHFFIKSLHQFFFLLLKTFLLFLLNHFVEYCNYFATFKRGFYILNLLLLYLLFFFYLFFCFLYNALLLWFILWYFSLFDFLVIFEHQKTNHINCNKWVIQIIIINLRIEPCISDLPFLNEEVIRELEPAKNYGWNQYLFSTQT